MIIERIKVTGFRSLKDVEIECDALLAVLGRNGSGKSTLLKAIEIFYNVGYQASEFDYFARNPGGEISICITFGSLRAREQEEFAPYIDGGNLTVTKVINSGGGRYYGVSRQLPEFSELRGLGGREKIRAINELVESRRLDGFSAKVRAEAEADRLMQEFEAVHPELLKPLQREEQFFGPRNVGGGKLDNFTKFVLVPAVRDASSETERKGVILQLIDILVARSINTRPDVKALNVDFEKRIREVYNTENLTELRGLAGDITKLLCQYAPGAELDLEFGEVKPPAVTLPLILARLVEDNFKTPISYTGHGLQRALVLALLQQLSFADLARTAEVSGVVETPGTDSQFLPDLILAIEEPELYLHPSRSRFLSKVLTKLSEEANGGDDPRTQVLFATHSPYFIDLNQFERIRLARKIPCDDSDVLQCRVSTYTRRDAALELARIHSKAPEAFTEDSFLAHATPVMNAIVNEGFFADTVVVVEGLSEVGALWSVQEILGEEWDKLGVVIVAVEGKTKIDKPVVVFRGLGIPTYFLFDADVSHRDKKEEKNTAALNAAYCRLAGIDPVTFPETQVGREWAVFSEDLEDEIVKAVGQDVFGEVWIKIADELGYVAPSKAYKNPEASARFIKEVYKRSHRIPVLENIVRAVSALRLQQEASRPRTSDAQIG